MKKQRLRNKVIHIQCSTGILIESADSKILISTFLYLWSLGESGQKIEVERRFSDGFHLSSLEGGETSSSSGITVLGYLFLAVTQGLGVSGIPCTTSSLTMLRKGAQHCDRCGEVPPVAFPTQWGSVWSVFGSSVHLSCIHETI